MSGAALPAAVLVTALFTALSFARPTAIVRSISVLVASAAAAAALGPRLSPDQPVLIACWLSVVAAALVVFRGRELQVVPSALLSANAGLWCGLLAVDDRPTLATLALAPLAFAGCWLVDRGYAVAIKVLASWLTAVAILALSLPLFTTPGNVPDHMD